jgi:hypothetical protein
MARSTSLFRQADITRALRAARAAGVMIARVEIDPVTGKIVIISKEPGGSEQLTDLDRWMASHAR